MTLDVVTYLSRKTRFVIYMPRGEGGVKDIVKQSYLPGYD